MEYKAEFAITLPEDLLDALGIDEDTLFEAYYDDGKIKVRILDEEALEDLATSIKDVDRDLDIMSISQLQSLKGAELGTCIVFLFSKIMLLLWKIKLVGTVLRLTMNSTNKL